MEYGLLDILEMPWFQQSGNKYQEIREPYRFISSPVFTQRDYPSHEKQVTEIRRLECLFIYVYEQNLSWDTVTSETEVLIKRAIKVVVCAKENNNNK